TVNFGTAVTVNAADGMRTLYVTGVHTSAHPGSSGSALTFSYTVAAGQNTSDLAVSSFNLNGATVKDGAGNTADLSGAANYNPARSEERRVGKECIAPCAPSSPRKTNGSGAVATV